MSENMPDLFGRARPNKKDLVAHKVRDTGDDFRNEVVNKGVLKLSKALGNIRSEIIEA